MCGNTTQMLALQGAVNKKIDGKRQMNQIVIKIGDKLIYDDFEIGVLPDGELPEGTENIDYFEPLLAVHMTNKENEKD